MAEDLGERTEPATDRRREEARRRGQVAQSRDLSSAVVLVVAIVGFQYFGEEMLAVAVRITRYCFAEPWLTLDVDRVRVEFTRLALWLAGALAYWTLALLGAAFLVSIAQSGFEVATERTFFDLSKLSPIGGFSRIFSLRGLARTALDVLKILLIGLVAQMFLFGEFPALSALAMMEFPTVLGYTLERALVLAYQLAIVLLILGIADYLYQRYQYEQDLRMTRQELREEVKDIEGDPLVKARRRQIQARLARQRILQKVPEAEVVITNPTEIAVAVKYRVAEMEAPIVVAMGAGIAARRIREIALEHKIPLIENKPLARLLFYKADLDRVIPEETFVAVAEILAYVYQITGRKVPNLAPGPGP